MVKYREILRLHVYGRFYLEKSLKYVTNRLRIYQLLFSDLNLKSFSRGLSKVTFFDSNRLLLKNERDCLQYYSERLLEIWQVVYSITSNHNGDLSSGSPL